jgi:hypothetical protein
VIFGQSKFGLGVQFGTAHNLDPVERNAPRLGELVFQLCYREIDEGKLPDPVGKVLRLVGLQQQFAAVQLQAWDRPIIPFLHQSELTI